MKLFAEFVKCKNWNIPMTNNVHDEKIEDS